MKHKGFNPPLTVFDKTLYWLFIIGVFAFIMLLMLLITLLQRKMTFQDARAVAFENTAAFLWAIPLVLQIAVTALTLLSCGLQYKIPLFGDSKIRYGEIPYKRSTYPIFKRKQYPQNIKKKGLLWIKKLVLIWCAVFILFSCLFSLSICSRKVLYDDSTIQVFNSFNSVKCTYSTEDYERLTISTYRSSSRYSNHDWHYQIEIQMSDGNEICFSNQISETAIDEFLEIKRLFSDEDIIIEGENQLEKVITDNNLSPSQAEKIKQLFSTP